jgi:hypothetical protein
MLSLLVNSLVFLLCAASFLQPFHSIPWPSALNDGLALTLGLLVSGVTLLQYASAKIKVTKLELAMLVAIVMHATIISDRDFQKSLLPVAAVIGVVLCCLKSPSPSIGILHSVFAGVFVSGVVSSVFGIGLWLGVFQEFENYQVWMSHTNPGAALIGNLSQPNQTGTLILWAIIVLLYFYKLFCKSECLPKMRWVFGVGAVFFVLLLAIGVALTQSRTALLNMVLIAFVVVACRVRFDLRTHALFVLAFLTVVIVTVGLPYFKSVFLGIEDASIMGGKTFADRPRLIAYGVFLNAVLNEWALGYGVGGVVAANLENMLPGNAVNMYFGHSHNIFVDMLIWFGVPLGLFLGAFVIQRLWRMAMQVETDAEMAILGMFLVIFVHAQLEYPLHYAYFLIPCAIYYRYSSASESKSSGFAVSVRLMFIFWVVSLFVFYLVAAEYLKAEQDIRQAKLQATIMGAPVSAPSSYENRITELRYLNVAMRADVRKPLMPHERAAYDYIVGVYPTKLFLNNYIGLLLQDGDLAGAQLWTARRDSLYTK